jgi:hypothetical protein
MARLAETGCCPAEALAVLPEETERGNESHVSPKRENKGSDLVLISSLSEGMI